VTRVLDTLAADPALQTPLREVVEHSTLSRDRRRLNEHYLVELRKRAKTPVHELPMLFAPTLDAAHVKQLSELL
jgi:DNA-binding transcriptional ArsR family regulator